jgi:hypothetical protein
MGDAGRELAQRRHLLLHDQLPLGFPQFFQDGFGSLLGLAQLVLDALAVGDVVVRNDITAVGSRRIPDVERAAVRHPAFGVVDPLHPKAVAQLRHRFFARNVAVIAAAVVVGQDQPDSRARREHADRIVPQPVEFAVGAFDVQVAIQHQNAVRHGVDRRLQQLLLVRQLGIGGQRAHQGQHLHHRRPPAPVHRLHELVEPLDAAVRAMALDPAHLRPDQSLQAARVDILFRVPVVLGDQRHGAGQCLDAFGRLVSKQAGEGGAAMQDRVVAMDEQAGHRGDELVMVDAPKVQGFLHGPGRQNLAVGEIIHVRRPYPSCASIIQIGRHAGQACAVFSPRVGRIPVRRRFKGHPVAGAGSPSFHARPRCRCRSRRPACR